MILRSLARRPNAIQCLATAGCRATPRTSFIRNVANVPTLAQHTELQRDGLPGLLSAKGFDIAYTQYQQHIVDELGYATDGTPWQNQETKALVVDFARDPMKAYLFNLASMAFNNHFFFRGINSNPAVTNTPSSDLVFEINKNFTSLDTLRETFLATADAMFGPGFVWLVQTNDSAAAPMRILTTYLAGSPLSGAHYRKQSHDMNTQNTESYQELNKVGAFGMAAKEEKKPKKALGGVDVVPLLCVNTWEHVWLHDYGVRGKREYLENWWNKIDWEQVRQYASITSRSQSQAMGEGHRRFVY